jgi:hypothetical protein
MIPPEQRAEELLTEWTLCKNAKSKGDAVNLQIERDTLEKWAQHLQRHLIWEPDSVATAEAVLQFESRLKNYKEKVIIEILTHGTV